MFFRERLTPWTAPRMPASLALALIIAVAGVLYLGIFPGRVLDMLKMKPPIAVSKR